MPAKDEPPLLFCPFCRECFEGETVCPDHELPLVTWDALPEQKDRGVSENTLLPFHELRYGRGPLALAVALIVGGFAAPLVTTVVRESSTATGVDVAMRVAPNLWAVPLVAAAFLSVLYRRRTLRGLRGVRVAVPVLAVLGATSLTYTLVRIHQGAAEAAERLGRPVDVAIEPGAWVMAVGLLIAAVAGVMLGKTRAA